ncbi:MAG: lytic transglycosylase domain-containing protein [Gammaproteobacteria bacterium]|nr:lytic transglycosylase domain-containing protein [Gammaproteobacteria bacterium]
MNWNAGKFSARWCWAIVAAACVLSHTVDAQIYKYVDKYGRVTLTDTPDHSGYKRLVKTWKGWVEARGIDYKRMQENRKRYTPAITALATEYALDEALLHAVITAESAYDPNAISTAGAVGLMQLMPATAQRYGVSNRRDPGANLRGGTRYLRDLLVMFDNNITLAVAAYNAGENAVIQYGKQIPPYEETRNYVRKVLAYYREYATKAG